MLLSAAEVRQTVEMLAQNLQGSSSNASDSYKRNITKLQESLLPYFTPAADGQYPAFGKQELTGVFDVLDGAFADTANVSREDTERMKSLASVFSRIDVTKGMNLPQAVSALKTVTLREVTQPGAAGDKSSSRKTYRMTLPGGRQVNGYFTEEEKYMEYDNDGKYMKFLEDYAAAHKENGFVSEFVERVRSHANKASALLVCLKVDTKFNIGDDPASIELGKTYNERLLASKGLIRRGEYRSFMSDKDFKAMLVGFRAQMNAAEADKYAVHGFQYGTHGGLHAEEGTSIPGRNTAMSALANLLGVPELIARTQPVSIEINGKKTEGVFMESAAGNDRPGKVEAFKESVFGHADPKGFTGKGLRNLADLQCLDFLGLNADRHARNMLYTFTPDGKLDTVVGIDNDMSFPGIPVGAMGHIMHSTALDNMKVISASMADRVSRLTPETLTAALQGTGLMGFEIETACQRLMTLQERIKASRGMEISAPDKIKSLTNGICIMPDDKWDEYNTDDLWRSIENKSTGKAEPEKNIFYFASSTQNLIGKHRAEPDKPLAENPDTRTFGDTAAVNQLSPAEMLKSIAKIKEYRERLIETTLEHGNKKQFGEMRKALDAFAAMDIREDTVMDDDTIDAYQNALYLVRKTTRAYVKYKTADHDRRETGVTRLKLANELLDVTEKHYDAYTAAAMERAEQRLSDDFLEAKTLEQNYDMVYNTVVERLAETQPGMSREDIEARIAENGVLERMMTAKNGLQDLAKLAADDPSRLMKVYQSMLAAEQAKKQIQPPLRQQPAQAAPAEIRQAAPEIKR